MATLIDSEPMVALAVIKGVANQSPAAVRNHLLDITFWCSNNDGAGFFRSYATFDGDTVGIDYVSTMSAYASIAGTGIAGNVIDGEVLTAYASIKGTPWVGLPTVGFTSNAWVKWADKDGNFTLPTTTTNKPNVAGERPMPFADVLYQAKKLGDNMVIYGKNGIAIMSHADLFWSVKTLLHVGLKSKNAVTGNEDIHYFLDREGILWELSTGGIKMHDYSNHLSVMSSATVMSYDERKKLVTICDGTYGFIFSQSGLGKCPVNITGMGYRGGTFYVTAPGAITNSAIQVWTDIWDGNSRYDKEIMAIGLGTDVTQDLFGAIAYRWNKAQAFNTTPWVKCDYAGFAHVRASGVEFKFGMKLDTYTALRLDSINVEVQYSELKPLGIG